MKLSKKFQIHIRHIAKHNKAFYISNGQINPILFSPAMILAKSFVRWFEKNVVRF